jgi:hypothetical protein
MKAQVSVELLVVVGVGLAIVSIYVLYSYNMFYSYKTNVDATITKESLQKIAKAAEFVLYQEEPARQKVNICLPSSIEGCYLRIDNLTLACNLTNRDYPLYYVSDVYLNGTLPQSSGCWDLILSAKDGYVQINQTQ